jgi:hypothetical protein
VPAGGCNSYTAASPSTLACNSFRVTQTSHHRLTLHAPAAPTAAGRRFRTTRNTDEVVSLTRRYHARETRTGCFATVEREKKMGPERRYQPGMKQLIALFLGALATSACLATEI